MLTAGEGRADITPPVGTILAGFHYPPDQPRRATGARMPSQVHALHLRVGDAPAVVLLSIDIIAVSAAFTARVQGSIAEALGIARERVLLNVTHTHSAPSLLPLLQWGEVSTAYADTVAQACLAAARAAQADATEADCYIGMHRVEGGNSNRTRKPWKTDADFGPDASPQDRWLDTLLQVLYFLRAGDKPALAWYHFSAHPVCFQDTLTGPDWPGLVADLIAPANNVRPVYLQGHLGDVNPGDGTQWIGAAEPTSQAIARSLHHAIGHSEYVEVDALRLEHAPVELPLDLQRFRDDLAQYRDHPEQCIKDIWVDPAFAAAWYAQAQGWDLQRGSLPAPVTALRLGGVALLFHPAELYSYYGLELRTRSPFARTLAVGLCGDDVGYLTDPTAYEAREYAAIVVPKILQYPPFTPGAAAQLTAHALGLLQKLA